MLSCSGFNCLAKPFSSSAQFFSTCRFISFLRPFIVLDPEKTIPLLYVLQPFLCHVSGKPLRPFRATWVLKGNQV